MSFHPRLVVRIKRHRASKFADAGERVRKHDGRTRCLAAAARREGAAQERNEKVIETCRKTRRSSQEKRCRLNHAASAAARVRAGGAPACRSSGAYSCVVSTS